MSEDEGMESSDFDSGSEEELQEEEDMPVNCFFCETVSRSIGESGKHCLQHHSFDIRSFIMKRVTSHYDLVKLVTYLRQKKPTTASLEALGDSKPWASDDYLLPVCQDDPWLWADDGLVVDDDDDEDEGGNNEEEEDDDDMETSHGNPENGVVTLTKKKFDELQDKNQTLENLLKQQEKKVDALKNLLNDDPVSNGPKPGNHADSYFESYSDFDIHRQMLGDYPRMVAYQHAIDPSLFKGKTVLDVGCGTGILSMMAASSGAVKVVGVENSDIFDAAVEIIRDNGFESKVTLIKGDIENIQLGEKFDIIISEWMGYFLLFERMLESIIVARNKFLKAGGLLLPNSCTLWLAGCSDLMAHNQRTKCSILGYMMEPLKRAALSEPAIEIILPDKIVTQSVLVQKIDISDDSTNRDNCCSFSSDFNLEITKDCELTSICGWFECTFDPTLAVLSTSPFSHPTHWAQTNFYFKQPMKVKAGSTIPGKIIVAPELDRAVLVTIELPSLNMKKTYSLH